MVQRFVNTIEMGRAFIIPEYQQKPMSLIFMSIKDIPKSTIVPIFKDVKIEN